LQRFGHDDPRAAVPVEVEGRRAGPATRQYREGYPMMGENLARPSFAFCQLDAVTGRHQPSR
jgi:hypothetical protein